jgi:hypothetical protein
MAAAASSPEDISTKPKPFERPVSLSITIFAESTVPNLENISFSCSDVAENGRLPT